MTRTGDTVEFAVGSARLRLRPHVPLTGLALAVLSLVTVGAHLALGSAGIGAADVVDVLRGAGDEATRSTITALRMPRPIVALAAGAAFGCSGALLQRLTGNPLAAPDLLGVVAGANLGVTVLALGFPAAPAVWRMPVALASGLALAGVVMVAGRGARNPLRVLLVGAGVAVVAQAVTIAAVATAGPVQAFEISLWVVGGLYGRGWDEVNLVVNALFVLLPAALLLSRALDHLQFGHDRAVALGVRVAATRRATLAVSVGLAAVAVAVTGPIAFVGLVAPHLARRLVGAATAGLVGVSALAGGLVVAVADLVARLALAPVEIPTGAIVPFIGVPLLLVLLRRGSR